MGDQDRGNLFLPKGLGDKLATFGAKILIERRKGLIQKQKPRLTDQRARQSRALLFTARKNSSRAIQKCVHSQQRREAPELSLPDRGLKTSSLGRENHVLSSGQMRKEIKALKYNTQPPTRNGQLREVLVAEFPAQRRARLEPREDPEHGRLARTRLAPKHGHTAIKDLPGGNFDGEVVGLMNEILDQRHRRLLS